MVGSFVPERLLRSPSDSTDAAADLPAMVRMVRMVRIVRIVKATAAGQRRSFQYFCELCDRCDEGCYRCLAMEGSLVLMTAAMLVNAFRFVRYSPQIPRAICRSEEKDSLPSCEGAASLGQAWTSGGSVSFPET